MSNHEHYEELGALAAIGQITPEEDKVLNAHLFECPDCREAYADYVRLLHKQLPLAEPRRWKSQEAVSRSARSGDLRERFGARAQAEGISLSEEARRPRRAPVPGWWGSFHWPHAVAAAAALGILALGALANKRYQIVPRSSAPNPQFVELTNQNERLLGELSAVNQSIKSKSAELARLQEQASASAVSLKALHGQLEEKLREAERLAAALQKAESESSNLASVDQQGQTLMAGLWSEIDQLNLTLAHNISDRLLQDARIRDLTEAVQAQTANLERERQLMAVSKDVRQLMGARNLHIIDVHDVDGVGKSAKSFGRVFYAEGKSLVFYAFDLPNGRLTPAKYSFLAWGQREAALQSPRNLGTFQVDDKEQHRWVLKVNDPSLLRGIDSVFVTAQAVGGPWEAGGKKILYAYLGGQPNHP
jgi:hypothetical protein